MSNQRRPDGSPLLKRQREHEPKLERDDSFYFPVRILVVGKTYGNDPSEQHQIVREILCEALKFSLLSDEDESKEKEEMEEEDEVKKLKGILEIQLENSERF